MSWNKFRGSLLHHIWGQKYLTNMLEYFESKQHFSIVVVAVVYYVDYLKQK